MSVVVDHELEDHDRGLAFDMSTLLQRRRVLQLIGGAGLLALVGCGSSAKSSSGSASTTSAAATTATTGSTATTAAAKDQS